MDVAYSVCEDCEKANRSTTSFSHVHPIVLKRLADTELVESLPFDPSYQWQDIFFARSHTRYERHFVGTSRRTSPLCFDDCLALTVSSTFYTFPSR